jgi:hypothetical protein
VIAALAGFGAGALHVVSGPDHLAALGPIAGREPQRAVGLGALWGVGHGVGVLLVAALGRLAGHALDLERLGGWAELVVGAALILLGARALGAKAEASHRHALAAGSAVGVGLLHGAAGAHHLFAVLPSLLLDPAQAAAYLGSYLVAAVGAMAAAGAVLAFGLRGRSPGTRERLRRGLAALAILTGVLWIGLTLG